jgi:hypothetical protein
MSVYLLPDGTLLRTGNANNTTFTAGGKGGVIEKIDWNGNVTWSYSISTTTTCQHHDVEVLPNGNILIIAWESKTNAEAIAAGRDPNQTSNTVWSEKIIEVQPTGTNGGNIVWEWHLWDHLIQDYDMTKPNYGVIATNPGLVNLNYNASASQEDWIHLNSIDYNPALDQILVSSHGMNEVWIIDHSTTTAEASSHLGGNTGKGGDLLYRWGNPAAYDNGTGTTQQFFGQHDAYWIPAGYPYENQIMVYNNGLNRRGGNYTTCEIINPSVNGFNYGTNLPYGPSLTSWVFNLNNTKNYYAQNISGAQQLSNGNVLLCNGPAGEFREVDSTGNTVWKYINPVSGQGIINQNVIPSRNLVFRCSFYPDTFSGFAGKILTTGSTIENSNNLSNSCQLVSSVQSALENSEWEVYPNPAYKILHVEYEGTQIVAPTIKIVDTQGQIVMWLKKENSQQLEVNIESLPVGVYFIHIESEHGVFTKKIIKT